MFQIDKTLGAIANLLAMINAANGTSFNSTNVVVGQPQAIVPDEKDNNTVIRLTGVADNLIGTVLVRYKRLTLAKAIAQPVTLYEYQADDVFNRTAAMTAISQAMNWSPGAVVGILVPTPEKDKAAVTWTFRPVDADSDSNLLYVPQTFTVSVKWITPIVAPPPPPPPPPPAPPPSGGGGNIGN
jgi:hypothetical protein